jgi:hypothetical protein
MPQFHPFPEQVKGTQVIPLPQTFAPPEPQIWPMGQVPQLRMLPHLSVAIPQLNLRSAHVCAVHAGWPQTFGLPPPPQDSGAVQLAPQSSSPPQPSGAIPQFKPCCWQVLYAAQWGPESEPESGPMKTPVEPPPPWEVPLVIPPDPPEWVPFPEPHDDVAKTMAITETSRAQI